MHNAMSSTFWDTFSQLRGLTHRLWWMYFSQLVVWSLENGVKNNQLLIIYSFLWHKLTRIRTFRNTLNLSSMCLQLKDGFGNPHSLSLNCNQYSLLIFIFLKNLYMRFYSSRSIPYLTLNKYLCSDMLIAIQW